MDSTFLNHIMYYVIIVAEIIIGLAIIISGIGWVVGDQTNNVERKRKSGLAFLISVSLLYFSLWLYRSSSSAIFKR